MQCPFLKQINFKKINQINNQEYPLQQEELKDDNFEDCIVIPEEQFNIPEEGIEITNFSDGNRKNMYCFSNLNIPSKTNAKLQIKFPKQLNTKHMFSPYAYMVSQENILNDQYQFSESQGHSIKNIPHVLTSKSSLMATQRDFVFHGEAFLEKEDQPENMFHCSIQNQIFKIYREGKIRYFFELTKIIFQIKRCSDKKAIFDAECKNKQIQIILSFQCTSKRDTFVKILQNNLSEITDERMLEEAIFNENLAANQNFKDFNSSYSLDSLGFQVERMSFEKIKQIGQTFDIILFKNKSLMSRMQRFLTNSDYDHIGMLLRTNSNELFLLEATSNAGVAVYTFDSLMKIPKGKYYVRIGLRKYEGAKQISQIVRLQKFVRESIGIKYKFDPMYLISSSVKKEDTYFCSELIAEALMRTQILAESRPSYKYLPKHFAAEDLNKEIKKGKYSEIIIIE